MDSNLDSNDNNLDTIDKEIFNAQPGKSHGRITALIQQVPFQKVTEHIENNVVGALLSDVLPIERRLLETDSETVSEDTFNSAMGWNPGATAMKEDEPDATRSANSYSDSKIFGSHDTFLTSTDNDKATSIETQRGEEETTPRSLPENIPHHTPDSDMREGETVSAALDESHNGDTRKSNEKDDQFVSITSYSERIRITPGSDVAPKSYVPPLSDELSDRRGSLASLDTGFGSPVLHDSMASVRSSDQRGSLASIEMGPEPSILHERRASVRDAFPIERSSNIDESGHTSNEKTDHISIPDTQSLRMEGSDDGHVNFTSPQSPVLTSEVPASANEAANLENNDNKRDSRCTQRVKVREAFKDLLRVVKEKLCYKRC